MNTAVARPGERPSGPLTDGARESGARSNAEGGRRGWGGERCGRGAGWDSKGQPLRAAQATEAPQRRSDSD